ncbi:MAG: TGS domain-containing protein [Thermosphaera sp.]|nr:TGS domain-containing protein [Thermosphaera sp.]
MPTNLPAEAKAKWIKVMEAKTPEEKVKALEEFLSAVPKHKGTERLREWATKRLAELREEIEERRRKKTGARSLFFIEKEGDVQVVVAGPPNTGKSLLVNKLTGARTIVADYPFSTTYPIPGMLKYNDVYFQLIDTPPITRGGYSRRVIGLLRNADGVLLVLDATRDYEAELRELVDLLRDEGILLVKPKGRVAMEVYRTGKAGIRVTLMGKIVDGTVEDIKKILEGYRIYNAHVKIYGEVSLDDVEQSIFESTVYKPVVLFINKIDVVEIDESKLRELVKIIPGSPIITGSAITGRGLDSIPPHLYNALEIIRVYTKAPNAPPSQKPLVLRKYATVRDVARSIHRDLLENFQYARVWGSSVNYPGERVGLDHVLSDGDIVEIHFKG